MRLLVTGGAGYIGSVVAAQLLEAGHQVVVLDDLSTGHADAVPAGAVLVRGTIRDAADVLAGGIDAVLHFAAKSLVGESVAQPGLYWSNNLGGTLALLEAMRVSGVRSIVFSSTAAVYGEPEHIPVTETDPARPTNPYGASKAAADEDPARVHPPARAGRGEPAVLQRSRGLPRPRRPLAGRAALPRDPPDPDHPAGRRRGPGADQDLRRRLPDAGRYLRAGLHPRGRPGPGAPARARRLRARTAPDVQPR